MYELCHLVLYVLLYRSLLQTEEHQRPSSISTQLSTMDLDSVQDSRLEVPCGMAMVEIYSITTILQS